MANFSYTGNENWTDILQQRETLELLKRDQYMRFIELYASATSNAFITGSTPVRNEKLRIEFMGYYFELEMAVQEGVEISYLANEIHQRMASILHQFPRDPWKKIETEPPQINNVDPNDRIDGVFE